MKTNGCLNTRPVYVGKKTFSYAAEVLGWRTLLRNALAQRKDGYKRQKAVLDQTINTSYTPYNIWVLNVWTKTADFIFCSSLWISHQRQRPSSFVGSIPQTGKSPFPWWIVPVAAFPFFCAGCLNCQFSSFDFHLAAEIDFHRTFVLCFPTHLSTERIHNFFRCKTVLIHFRVVFRNFSEIIVD